MSNQSPIANINPFEEQDALREQIAKHTEEYAGFKLEVQRNVAIAENQILDLQRQVKMLLECVTMLMRGYNGLSPQTGNSSVASAETKQPQS